MSKKDYLKPTMMVVMLKHRYQLLVVSRGAKRAVTSVRFPEDDDLDELDFVDDDFDDDELDY